jgi:hypothetical protein
MVDKVVPTFDSWNPQTKEFDQRVARKFRAEATHLFTLQADATGAVSHAIAREARALTDMSIAMSESNDPALGRAADQGNSALAQLRGTCNF